MICGVDEAGRGPVIGPLVVAGVVFENDKSLVEINVRDSKKCTPKKREYLAKKIRETAVDYETMVISASDIDNMRRVMTLNEIEINAFSRVIERLKPDICYVDSADVDEKRFGKNISSKLSFKITIISKHKADIIYPIVGAASILAKTIRDEEIHKIAEKLEKEIHVPLGSGYPADPITQHFIKTWVETFGELPPHVRHSWKTVYRFLEKNRNKRLNDFLE
ncbi:MAG: ribonuclease HII [Thermoplasmata archaeon]|nr:MAG: ribonuclease HII [Thermoplasmata archaeon]